MKTSHSQFRMIATASIILISSCSPAIESAPKIRSEIKTRAIPSIEQVFGPSYKSILLAIRRFEGEEAPAHPTATNIEHSVRSSAYVKTIGEPTPKEKWKCTFWVVEGDWIPPIDRPAESNLCVSCRTRLRVPHVPLYLYAWLDVQKNGGFLCERDGARFGFAPMKFAKCRAQTRTITYTSKADPSRQMKLPRYSVECLATCANWEEFENSEHWKEERVRKDTYMKWWEEQKRLREGERERPKTE